MPASDRQARSVHVHIRPPELSDRSNPLAVLKMPVPMTAEDLMRVRAWLNYMAPVVGAEISEGDSASSASSLGADAGLLDLGLSESLEAGQSPS